MFMAFERSARGGLTSASAMAVADQSGAILFRVGLTVTSVGALLRPPPVIFDRLSLMSDQLRRARRICTLISDFIG
jgi:hypothetical protein